MFFVSRAFVCERLRVSAWSSYRLAPANSTGMIRSDSVISLLNRSRRSGELALDFIPSDIVTAEELEKDLGIPSRKIVAWTRRKRCAVPHFRINKQTTRFRRESVMAWLERRSRG